MDTSTTSALLRRARDGSREALDDLFDRCGARLLAFVRLRMRRELRDRMESRDVLQATLLKAFERIDDFEGSGARSLMAWLARIAENEMRDRVDYGRRQRRDGARQVRLDGRELDAFAAVVRSQTSRIVLAQRARDLEAALDRLSPDHRDVIVLRAYEELSFPEIGRRLGKTPDAGRMLYARAMAALSMIMREGES